MAGYGNIVGYEDAPMPGAYYFTDKGGAKRLFSGPVAEDLKAKIDASAALAPKPLAGVNPNGTNMPVSPAQGGMPAAVPESRLDAGGSGASGSWDEPAPGQAAPAAAAPAAQTLVARVAANQQAAQAAGAAPAGPRPIPGAPGLHQAGLGLAQDSEGAVYERVGPTAASKGGLIERGRTVSGGFEKSADYEEAMANASIDEGLALEHQNAATEQDTATAKQIAEEEYQRQVNRTIEANQKAAQVSAGVAALEAKHNAAIDAIANFKEDPKKAEADVYGDKKGLWGILAIIGGTGSALSGQPDRVSQLIETRINRNIEAQRTELNVKRDNANNLLQKLTMQMGDQKLAELTLRDAQTQMAANELQRKALLSKSDKDRAMYLSARADLEKKAAQRVEEYRVAAAGNVTKSLVNVPGSAGSAGGWRRLGTEQQLTTAEKLSKLSTPAAAAGADAKAIPTERTDKIAAMAEAIDAADSVDTMLQGKEGEIDNPTSGPIDMFPTESGNQLNAVTSKLAKGAQAARGKSDKDAELAEEDAIGNGSVNARKRGAAAIRMQSARGIAAELITLPPEQQQKILQTMSPSARASVAAAMKPGAQQ